MPATRKFPTAPIGVWLTALVAGIVVPLLAFAAILVLQLEINEHDALQRRTLRDANSLATGVGRQFQDMATTLKVIASAPELANGDLAAFHERTQTALRESSLYILLVRADGQQLLNTRVPFGTELPKTSNMAVLEAALASGDTVISDVFYGATSRRWVFNVVLPLAGEQARNAAALIMTQNADDLGRLVTTEGLPEGWSSAVLDASGNTVISSQTSPTVQPEPFSDRVLAQFDSVGGVLEEGLDSPQDILGYARIPSSAWRAVVWGPVAAAQSSILITWRYLLFGGLVLVVLAMTVAWIVSRQLRVPIRGLADMAVRMGNGEIVSPIRTRIAEANTIANALADASFDRSQAEDRQQFILHELAHRTKNLLTVIQAMMRQTARKHDSIEEFQAAISQRLDGLARSISLLTAQEWSGVAMRQLLETHLSTFAGSADRVAFRGDDFYLRPEAVQNLGLTLHELATNAVKYGALSVPGGHVAIDWKEAVSRDGEPQLALSWVESGGPPAVEPERQGFGTTVIDRHTAAAFGGRVTMKYGKRGFRWRLTAPRRNFAMQRRD
ncbi:MAG: HWE histidine kinase domain-containing protein [Flavobacteriaceae bacterium]